MTNIIFVAEEEDSFDWGAYLLDGEEQYAWDQGSDKWVIPW